MKTELLERLGKPGIAGLGVLLFCISFYAGNLGPARSELTALQAQITQLNNAARPTGGVPGSASPVAKPLPAFSTATDAIKELVAIADRHGVTMDRATYQLEDKEGKRRLEISLPLKGNYASLRDYLLEVLALPTAPALDEVSLQRPQAVEPLLEANIRFSYYFTPGP